MGVLHHFALRFCLRCIDVVFFATHLPYLGNGLGFQRLTLVVAFSIFVVWMKVRVCQCTCMGVYGRTCV